MCGKYVDGLSKPAGQTKKVYRSNFANPAVQALFEGKTVIDAVVMDHEVTGLLNGPLGRYTDVYRNAVLRIITGALGDWCAGGSSPGTCSAASSLARARSAPSSTNVSTGGSSCCRIRSWAISRTASRSPRRRSGPRTRVLKGAGIAPWLQRTMGLRIREALGVRKSDFKERADGSRYLHLCWQASMKGTCLEPLKRREAGQFRDIPVPDMVWDMVQAMGDGPLCPGPRTAYMSYGTAEGRYSRILESLGIEGVTTHTLRHQFATEALESRPGELATFPWRWGTRTRP